MSVQLFKTIKSSLPECNKLPEIVKEIINSKSNSLKDLNKNDSKRLWISLHDFLQETSVLKSTTQDKELLSCYKCILNIIHFTINNADHLMPLYENEYILKTMMIFQSFFSQNFKFKLKLEILKIYLSFWKLAMKEWAESDLQNETYNNPIHQNTVMPESFTLTLSFLFDSIKLVTKKSDMKILSTSLWEFCKSMHTLFKFKNVFKLIVFNMENIMKFTLFLDTESGKLAIAEIFTVNQQLFLKFHQIVKQNLPKAKKLEAEAYGEIYFMAWINSNVSMREIIEQQGMFDLISKTLILRRIGKSFRTYHNALILLQSMQMHRKHLVFSKVITKLYAPVLWRQLMSEFKMVRCNATEVLTRAYPLEKRGEGREVSSRFLIKQQNAFLDLLEDDCPQVRIAAIKGICSCMRYFWDSFEDDKISKCFSLFARLIDESVFEVRQALLYSFCQLLDENRSLVYFNTPSFVAKMKKILNDENEKVRRAFLHFLLKVKKVDSKPENINKINFTHIVNLNDVANALAQEDKQNGYLLVELVFDNFIGDKIADKNATLQRLHTFYKMNPNACRKLILYSNKNLDLTSACKLSLSLLQTMYNVLKKEENLKNIDKENNIPAKKSKLNDDLVSMSDTSSNSSSSSLVNNSEEVELNKQIKMCCILDCVNCLMTLHRDAFADEENRKSLYEIQDACSSCLVKLLKLYKDGDAYYSALNLASLIPVSKLTAHVSAPSTALSILKQLPLMKEEIDMRKVNCLVYTLCMWKRGYEILQFVYVWFDEAFKSLNLNDSQYPQELSVKDGKRVRFKTNIEDVRPVTGILLVNSMLSNLQTQETLVSTDVNKTNLHDLFLYLQRIMPAIENRISSDCVLNGLLTDEVLIGMFQLHIRLNIIHQSQPNGLNIDVIIKYQTCLLDWIINNILIHDLHHKNGTTITLVVKIITVVNHTVLNMCLMECINNEFLENYFVFCATILHNHFGPRVLIPIIETFNSISSYFNYLKCINNEIDTSKLVNCTCSIISILGESKLTDENFTDIIGSPIKFRQELIKLILGINKLCVMEFKRVIFTLIENIIQINANQIQEIDEVDLNEQLSDMPFAAYQLALVALNNVKQKKLFSSTAMEIFSSNSLKNDCALLLSAISFVYTLSFHQSQSKTIDLEPVVRLLYKILVEQNNDSTPLGNNCIISYSTNNQESKMETSDFSVKLTDYKKKGRDILITTAKRLHITLAE